jgi:hypothetical protein
MVRCSECPKNAYYGNPGDPPTHCRDHQKDGMRNVGLPACEEDGCFSSSRSFGFPGQKGVRCKKHALPGMVNVCNLLCEHKGCVSKSRTFDVPGGKGRFCKEHALSTMVNVRNRLCDHPGCTSTSRNFGVPGGKGRFCLVHKQEGMIDVLTQRCIHPGCETRANFSMKGQPPRYCGTHKLPGMCNRQACEHEGCTVLATYNYLDKGSGRFCASHKLDGMICIRAKVCNSNGCKKTASFGTTVARFCKDHAEEGMRNLCCKYCENPDCDISACYGVPGQRPRFCQRHAEEGMVSVIGRRCDHPGCKCRSRSYDVPGGKGRFCTTHKEPGMVDVKNPKCVDCGVLASYGIPGGKPSRCARHRLPGMLTRPRARCVVCRKPAIYGKSFIPRHCESHKEEDDDNLMERHCVSCGLTMVLDTNNRCEFCDPTRFETNRLAKQTALMEYLDRKGLRGNSTDVVIDKGACGRERPDRIFDFDDKIVILECDEHQHRDRQCLCEQTRMINITQSYGGIPVYFIRWNPDNYIAPGLPDPIQKRHKLVADFIRDIRDNSIQLPTALASVFYMYYDGWTGMGSGEWTQLLAFESSV